MSPESVVTCGPSVLNPEEERLTEPIQSCLQRAHGLPRKDEMGLFSSTPEGIKKFTREVDVC